MFPIKVTACLHFGPKQIPPIPIEWFSATTESLVAKNKTMGAKNIYGMLIVTDGNTIFFTTRNPG